MVQLYTLLRIVLYTLCRIGSRVGGPRPTKKHKKKNQKVVHFAPESIVHFTPDFIVHYTPEYSIGAKILILHYMALRRGIGNTPPNVFTESERLNN